MGKNKQISFDDADKDERPIKNKDNKKEKRNNRHIKYSTVVTVA